MNTSIEVIPSLAEQLAMRPWQTILQALNKQGFAVLKQILTGEDCTQLIQLYDDPTYFRNRVVMQCHGFGQGEYQYFAYPLPAIVETVRRSIFPRLVALANQWNTLLAKDFVFADTLPLFLEQCHHAGQAQPTPLLLKYKPGDFNCLHQDLYGAVAFPFQMTVLLNEPDAEFVGGEFVLVEQKPRAQSKVEVISLHRGDAIIFATSYRPAQGKRGHYRVNLRHGVSQIHTGQRFSLGVIFHDAT